MPSIPEVFLVVLDTVFPQQETEFILVRHLPMVLLLGGNVATDIILRRVADREGTVAGLPGEGVSLGEGVVNPPGGGRLQLAEEIGKCRLLAESDEQVNMIGGAADLERDSAFTADDSAEVFPQTLADVRGDEGSAMFGAEDEVVMEAGVGLGHWAPGIYRPSGA